MDRRAALCRLGACLALPVLARGAYGQAGEEPVRIGLTPVFLDDQVGFVASWREYFAQSMGRAVEFVQRGSYREVVDLMRQGKLDFAWLCGYPYVRGRQWFRLLAVPTFQGEPLYHSYLIVPASDTTTASIFDLRARIFAFSDPDSNSGYLYPNYQLVQAKASPAQFFRRTFFTYAHKKVVEAVGLKIAQGGAVDGYVWETLRLRHPKLTARTRVADRSPAFGFPPFVAAPFVPPALFAQMQEILLAMHEDAAGAAILRQLNLDRFEVGAPSLYADIERMVQAVGDPVT